MFRRYSLVGVMVSALALWASPALAQDPPKPDAPKQEEKKPDAEKKADGEAADVSGNWDLTVETQGGPMTVGLALKMENEKITGTIKGPQGDMDVSGTISEKELTFAGSFATSNGELKIAFTGAPGKEKMEGQVDFGGRGGGKWTATRAKPQ